MTTTKTFDHLKKDHEKVKSIIDELLKTSMAAKVKRKTLLHDLKQELQSHEEIEEEYVYPLLKSKKLTHDLALEAYQKHHIVDLLLEELESLEFKDENWKAKLSVLQEGLLNHINEEENDLFVKANQALSQNELQQMAENIEKAESHR